MKCYLSFLAGWLITYFSIAQVSIKGSVSDYQTGAPLIGASVLFDDTSLGTETTSDGIFELRVEDISKNLLRISFVGYQTAYVNIDDLSEPLSIKLKSHFTLEEVVIHSIRAPDNQPIAKTTLYKTQIDELNIGQDPVFTLEKTTPSILAYSESGTNFANYSQLRLRGIDQTRINITLNGVPLNDMIDQGVFFSNFSDFSSNIQSIQIQRGVGTSTNGTSSYGGSINFESPRLMEPSPSAEIEFVGGSFGTYRMSGGVYSGRFKSKFGFYSRYTKTISDGYKFHSGTNSDSYFFSGVYFTDHDMLKLTTFVGRTRNELAYLPVWINNIQAEPRTNYVNENDEDDFGQQFVQMQHTRWFRSGSSLTSSIYYGGAGGDFPFGFNNPDSTFSQINFPLQNNHIGLMSAYSLSPTNGFEFSAGIHLYTFRRENQEGFLPEITNPYYSDKSQKDEFSLFGKASYRKDKIVFFADFQFRTVGLDLEPDTDFLGDPLAIIPRRNWSFFNPKFGVTYKFNSSYSVYGSFGRSGREPTRADILGSTTINSFNLSSVQDENAVKAEYVNDFEAGLRISRSKLTSGLNLFYMIFDNEIAPIGAFIPAGFVQLRKNIKNSYRTGFEVDWNWGPSDPFNFYGTFTYQKSLIDEFSPEGTGLTYSNVEPILSPEYIINGGLSYSVTSWLKASIQARYVSDSFLELTNQPDLDLPAFVIADLDFSISFLTNYLIKLQLNNIFDDLYYASGAPVDVDFDGLTDGPGYLVQPPRNFFITLRMKF